MRSRIIFLTIFILTISKKALPCDCISEGEFLKVAPKSNFVSLIKVTKYLTFIDIEGTQMPMSMEVEIIDIYKGKETKKRVVVWGDNGIQCRPYLSKFKPGEYWLNADIIKKTADGAVTEKQSQIKLADLKAKLKT
jgi:hypothetical protein